MVDSQIGVVVPRRLLSLLACLWSGAIACTPSRPPARVPVLVVAGGPLRVVEDVSAPRGAAELVVRAGSAYDPPGREGLAFVLAHGLAERAGVEVTVGPELVRFLGLEGRAAALAAALVAEVDDALVQAGAGAVHEPDACAAHARQAALAWGLAGHPYGHRVEGRTSVLPTLRAGEVQAFRQLRYVRDAAVLVTGSGADVAALLEALPPALSRSVTPAVAVTRREGSVSLVAPVPTGCAAWALPSPSAWTPQDEALLHVATRIVGDPPPPARIDPVWVISALPDDEALLAGFAWARADVVETLEAESGFGEAASLLLGRERGGHHFPAPVLAPAVAELEPSHLVACATRVRAGGASLWVIPSAEPDSAESERVLRVPSVEELLR